MTRSKFFLQKFSYFFNCNSTVEFQIFEFIFYDKNDQFKLIISIFNFQGAVRQLYLWLKINRINRVKLQSVRNLTIYILSAVHFWELSSVFKFISATKNNNSILIKK